MTVFTPLAPAEIRTDQIVTAYQPIVDKDLNICSAELLCRRYFNGSIQLPGAFLRENMPISSWKDLTGIMLDDAVNRINEQKGSRRYHVNVPSALTTSQELVSLVACSLLRLISLEHAPMLALEFSEHTDYKRHHQAVKNIHELREMGVRIYFDDIFSPSSSASLHLPCANIPFSGFKIDMRAVWQAQEDSSIRRKIEKLATFCREKELDCIAEGIESYADVSLMASLGVEQYQGFLISPALKWSSLALKSQVLRLAQQKRLRRRSVQQF